MDGQTFENGYAVYFAGGIFVGHIWRKKYATWMIYGGELVR